MQSNGPTAPVTTVVGGCESMSEDVGVSHSSSPAAVAAAQAAGAAAGYPSHDVVTLQDTNNVVVWLQPHPVVAKVGVRPGVVASLHREVDVCRFLHGGGAPVGEPLGWFDDAQLPVSLWRHVRATGAPCSDQAHAAALNHVHHELRRFDSPLPDYWTAIELAHEVLLDDDLMHAVAPDDLGLLRNAFDRFAAATRSFDAPVQPLHGEPHSGNIIGTDDGPVLIDFEATCIGPIEWDVACSPLGVAAAYVGVNLELVDAARLLNAVRVATWCLSSTHPAMRPFGLDQLEIVRRATAG